MTPPHSQCGHARTGLHVRHIVGLPAARAVVFCRCAVQLIDVPGAGFLVQAVYVLGDDGEELAFPLPLCQLFMRGVGCASVTSIFSR